MNYKIVKNYKTILFNIFSFVLLFISFYLVKNTYLRLIGIVCITVMFIIIIFDVICRIDKIEFNKTWMWFSILTLYNFIMMARTPTARSLYSYILETVLLLLVTLSTSISLNEKEIKKVFKYGKIICFMILIPAIIIALEGGRGAFGKFDFILNPSIYKIILPCTFFFIAGSKHKSLKVFAFVLIYLRMVERTTAIALIVIYMVYLVLKKLKVSKGFYRFIFIGTFIMMIGFVYGYVELQYTEIGNSLNDLFMKYTGGNFFSGRSSIWYTAFTFIKQSPIIGHGLDNGLMGSAGVTLSTHNTYILLLLQGGILRLMMFFMFMYSIWEKFFNCLDDDIVKTSAAYLIGFLVFINLEVTLIGNSAVMSIFMWVVLGIGVMQCNNLKRSIDETYIKKTLY